MPRKLKLDSNPKYPQHLCPLCGKVLRIAENYPTGSTHIKVKIECINEDCPYESIYDLSISNIRNGIKIN